MRIHEPIVVIAACLSALFVTALVGCSSSTTSGGSPMGRGGSSDTSGGASGGASGGGMMGGGGSAANSYSSDGQRIFLSGVGTNGQDIPRSASRVSQGSLMMGGGGCGSCHGASGLGGQIRMMTGAAVDAPNITYDALIEDGFTDATIRQAIRDGVDESGKPLGDAMPRWQMTDADLEATIAYLKELSVR